MVWPPDEGDGGRRAERAEPPAGGGPEHVGSPWAQPPRDVPAPPDNGPPAVADDDGSVPQHGRPVPYAPPGGEPGSPMGGIPVSGGAIPVSGGQGIPLSGGIPV